VYVGHDRNWPGIESEGHRSMQVKGQFPERMGVVTQKRGRSDLGPRPRTVCLVSMKILGGFRRGCLLLTDFANEFR